MQDKIKKLQEFTQVVKANLDSMYREGSAEANKISPAEVVNTFAILDMSEKLDKLIVTDSIPENILLAKDVMNMQVISIKPLIEKIIFRE